MSTSDLKKEEVNETEIEPALANGDSGHHNSSIIALALGALGVVYGDIGTSPLYAIKECFYGTHSVAVNEANILGVLSLVFWSLTMVVTFKYLTHVMKADNHGEGGIFALLALTPSDERISKRTRSVVVLAALMGASLLYGDGIITPAISVLSAIEGIEVATEAAKPVTVPLTCLILFILFYFQKKGTGTVGRIFGPVMVLWFSTISVLGLIQIFKNPAVLAAINPVNAINFFILNQFHGFVVLGSVVLCITGGEALYADMGHFGRKPIQLSWYTFVFPALLLNYFGQGALLLSNPNIASNPFFELVPKSLIIPMVILATGATIIASQALISGAFSLTRQGIQLGFFPRLNIIHTSADTEGQIYIPSINKAMMIGCIAIVLMFKNSSNLAAAYGIAVTANMILTSIVFYFVMTKTWHYSKFKAVPLTLFFLIFDSSYFGSNLLKFWHGGWFPILLAVIILTLMLTWRDGRIILAKRMREIKPPVFKDNEGNVYLNNNQGTAQLFEPTQHLNNSWLPMEILSGDIINNKSKVPGTAVFMSVSLKSVPPVLIHHLKHNKTLHENIIFLSIKSVDIPYVRDRRIEISEVGFGFYRVIAYYGFMETPNVPEIIENAKEQGLKVDLRDITYYLGRESLIISNKSEMMKWRKTIFAFMSRNALPATSYFSIPANKVVELGIQIEI